MRTDIENWRDLEFHQNWKTRKKRRRRAPKRDNETFANPRHVSEQKHVCPKCRGNKKTYISKYVCLRVTNT